MECLSDKFFVNKKVTESVVIRNLGIFFIEKIEYIS